MNTRSEQYLLLVILLLLGLTSCANRLTLGGGPRDERPPELDTSSSFRNLQVGFIKEDIQLYFDEFITLRNPGRQVVISPPLSHPPKIEGKGKKISLQFDEEEVFKRDATYIINFGESITDYTEGNVLDNFTIVFSTGDYIDSLSVRGKVTDAFTGEEKADVLVMLYDVFEDSIIYRERPFYFAKTTEEGSFVINNIREDTFKVVVLGDQNLNYLYDPASEEIGFMHDLLSVNSTEVANLELEIFKERRPPRYLGYDVPNRGQIVIQFDQEVESERIRPLDSLTWLLTQRINPNEWDLWYTPIDKPSIRLELPNGPSLDTVQVRINQRSVNSFTSPLTILELNDNGPLGLHPEEPLEISFDRPVASIDSSLFLAVDTSTMDTVHWSLKFRKKPGKVLYVQRDWSAGQEWSLTVLPGAFTDLYGATTDTIVRVLRVADKIDFGSIEITTEGVDTTVRYQIDLMQRNEVIASNQSRGYGPPFRFEKLIPGDYSMRIVVDLNGNGKWDPGNYHLKLQSEQIFMVPLERVRNNWNTELNLVDLLTNEPLNEVDDE